MEAVRKSVALKRYGRRGRRAVAMWLSSAETTGFRPV